MARPVLAAIVEDGLGQRWSPAEIAARLLLDHPDEPGLRVSHETINSSFYLQGRGGLKRELITSLRSGRLRRRSRRRGETAKRANVLGDIVPVSARPPEAADRSVPGRWEGDLPDGHDAQSVYECLLETVGDLPDLMRRSLTWDQAGSDPPTST